MPNSPPPVVKKKVKPYPFNCLMEGHGKKHRVQVVQLTVAAFMASIKGEMLHVGEHYQVEFDIPVSQHTVIAKVIVVKTYDRAVDPRQHMVERLAEFHFESLTGVNRQAIVSFLSAIGQK